MNQLMQLSLVMQMVDKTSQPLKAVTQNAEKVAKATDKATKSTKKARKEADKAAKSTKKTSETVSKAATATDKAAKAVENLGTATEKWTRRGKNWLMWGQGFETFGNSIVNKFKKPVDAYARLENGMSSLKVAMMDSTGAVSDRFKKLSDLAVDLSNKLPTTAEEMHKVAAAGIAMGMSADSMINGGLKAASNFAMAAMGGDFTRSMEITNALQKSWKIDSEDLEKTLDLMARAKSVGVNVEDMTAALGKTGLVAQGRGEAGYGNFEKMMPYLTTILATGTMTGETVGENFSKIMSRALTADMTKFKKIAGFELNFTKNGKFAGLENMVNELQKLVKLDASKQAEAIASLFGDSVAINGIVSLLISEGNRGVQNMANSMQKFASIQKKVDEANNTLSAKWNAFTGTLDTSFGKLAMPLDGLFKSITDGLNKVAAGVGDFAEKHQTLTQILGGSGIVIGLTALTVGKLATNVGMFMFYLPGTIAALKATRNLIVTHYALLTGKVIPSIWASIMAHQAQFAASIVGAAGMYALGWAISQVADQTTEAGSDFRVLASGLDGFAAVMKKFSKFLLYFVTFGRVHLGTAEDEAAIDEIGKREKVGRFAEVAQPDFGATNVSGDSYEINLEVNNNGKDMDPAEIKRQIQLLMNELKAMEKRDAARKYAAPAR